MSMDISMSLTVNPGDGMNVNMIIGFKSSLRVNIGLWVEYN